VAEETARTPEYAGQRAVTAPAASRPGASPGVHVQARQGYFAVRTPLPTPLLDYESPVLAALEMAPRANDLAFLLAVAQVPDQADESAVPVLVEVAGDVPTLDLDPKAKRYQQDFTVPSSCATPTAAWCAS
jgi:hypothetical protein